jgi:hypothetical protein
VLEVFYCELFLSSRDERTTSRALAQLKDRHKDFHEKDRVVEDAKIHSERKAEVHLDFFISGISHE